MKPLSRDLRQRIVSAYENDEGSHEELAERFTVSKVVVGKLVLDNLSSHKSTAAVEAIESEAAKVIYLPPYSPDLNPIENVFSEVKQLIRGLRPRNWRDLIQSVKQTLQRATPNDLRHIRSAAIRPY